MNRQRDLNKLSAAVFCIALLVLSTCGPVKWLNVGKRFELYDPVYRATVSDLGRADLEALIENAPHRDRLGVVSQELPFSFASVWRALGEVMEDYPPGTVDMDQATGTVRTDMVSFTISPLSFEIRQQLWMKVIATDYGTTVVHQALLRLQTAPDRDDASLSSDADLQRRLEALEQPLVEPEDAPGMFLLPRLAAFRYAVVNLSLLGEKVAPDLAQEEYPARVSALARAHHARIAAPSALRLAVEFVDADSALPNGLLDPGEVAYLDIEVSNEGEGEAFGVEITAETSTPKILENTRAEVGDLPPSGIGQTRIELRPDLELGGESATIVLQAREERDYRSQPVEVVVPVGRLVPPSLAVARVEVDDRMVVGGDGDGILGAGENAQLVVRVVNEGRGPAAGVLLRVEPDSADAVDLVGEVPVGDIPPSGAVDARFGLGIPRMYAGDDLRLRLIAADVRGSMFDSAPRHEVLSVVPRLPLIDIRHQLFDGDSPDSRGDRNGVASNGERLALELRLLNRGRLSAEDVELTLSTPLPGVRPDPATLSIGRLPPGSISSPERISFEIPRGLATGDRLPVGVEIRQRDFMVVRHTLELPFTERRPDVRVGPSQLGTLRPGEVQSRILRVINVGELEAKDVRVSVGGEDETDSVQILGSGGESGRRTTNVPHPLAPGSDEFEIPVALFARRTLAGRQILLEVQVEQRDFDTRTFHLSMAIAEELPERVEVPRRGASFAAPSPRSHADSDPPTLVILTPSGSGTGDEEGTVRVDADHVKVEGVVRDDRGIFQVLIDGKPVEVDGKGRFAHWRKLSYGRNTIRVVAIDLEDNRSSTVLELERMGQTAGTRRDRAILFVTGRYETWPDLANPVLDGRAIRDALEHLYGFEVELIENPTKETVLRTFRRYATHDPGGDDQLLIFFAGHGHYDEILGEGYIVTRDSLRADDLGQTYIAHSGLSTIVNHLPYRHILVVLDVCFGGTFDQRIRSTDHRGDDPYTRVSREEFIRRKLSRSTRYYITSGGEEYVPEGRPGRHTPFVQRVLDGLRAGGGEDEILTVRELTSYVERLEPEPRAGGFGDNQIGSDFLFVREK